MSDSCIIDEIGPMPVVRPGSAAELSDLVRRHGAERQALFPLGGRTMLDLGLPPARSGQAVDLRGLTQVIDYPARDMTITVETGITLGRLGEILAAEKQRLPVDVPRPREATLGGALAANISGPRRHGWGTLRDYVIGITVVNDEGQPTKAGGRVVKNVAGYDLCKLHIGALGTLGIITQVTLKLRPIPEATRLVGVACSADDLVPLLEIVHRSQTRASCVDLVNSVAAEKIGFGLNGKPWGLLVGYEQNEQAVAWQASEFVERELPEDLRKVAQTWSGPDAEKRLADLGESTSRPEAVLSFKANVLPHAVADFCRTAAALSDRLAVQAHAGNGIVLGHVDGDFTLDQAQSLLLRLTEKASAGGGNLIVRRCPSAWKKVVPIWGKPRGDAFLMREVKRRLDPRDLFNPGRFVPLQ